MPRLGQVRKLSEADRRQLMTEQSALTALTMHPSWPTLVEVINGKQEKLEQTAVAHAFSSKGLQPVHAAYLRGFRDGMRYIVRVPANAELRLENYLKAQGIQSEGES